MRTAITLALSAVFLFACSTEQFYAAGRSSQRAECLKQADAAARDRCLKDANTSYDTYKKETDAAHN
jgi:high-affinity K+ transport system ATPase subunit B